MPFGNREERWPVPWLLSALKTEYLLVENIARNLPPTQQASVVSNLLFFHKVGNFSTKQSQFRHKFLAMCRPSVPLYFQRRTLYKDTPVISSLNEKQQTCCRASQKEGADNEILTQIVQLPPGGVRNFECRLKDIGIAGTGESQPLAF